MRSEETQQRTYGGYRYDQEIENLIAPDGKYVGLRTQTVRVFKHLQLHSDHLVRRDDLIESVWPTVVVSDDSLVQCISEIRKAIKDKTKQILKTIHRRGYILRSDKNPREGAELAFHFPSHDVDCTSVVLLSTDDYCLQSSLISSAKDISHSLLTEIQIDLSHFSGLEVKQLSLLAEHFWSNKITLENVGRINRAKYLVSINVLHGSGVARAYIKLFNTITNSVVWGDKYELNLDSILDSYKGVSQKAAVAIDSMILNDRNKSAMSRSIQTLNAEDHYAIGLTMISDSPESNLMSRQHFKAAMDMRPDSAVAISAYARTYAIDAVLNYNDQFEGSLERARFLLEKAVSLNDLDSRVLGEMGHFWSTLKEFDMAHTYFERAIKINPLDTDSMVRYGWSLAFSGQAEQGLKMIENGLRIHPFSPGWYTWNYGIASFLYGDYASAYRSLKTFCTFRPNHPRPRRLLAVASSSLGYDEEAENIVKLMIDREPMVSLSVESELQHRLLSDSRKVDDFLGRLNKAGMPS